MFKFCPICWNCSIMLDLNAHLTWENFIKVVEVSQIEESCFTCPICFALKRGQLHHEQSCKLSSLNMCLDYMGFRHLKLSLLCCWQSIAFKGYRIISIHCDLIIMGPLAVWVPKLYSTTCQDFGRLAFSE
jgi:hypothetical protein